MARNTVFSNVMAMLCISSILFTQTHSSTFQPPKELASKFSYDPKTLSLAATDYGHVVHETPWAVFEPHSDSDIKELISYSNSLHNPFTIAARGPAHSSRGQTMTKDGVVLNMTSLNNYNNWSRIVVSCDKKLGCYVDAGGEQLWIDVLNAALKHGLTPPAFTDYLSLCVGGTLSNAGINGGMFRFGPQISNVLELDVITGTGKLVTCSPYKNSEVFYAVLGGLGQFGVITRARIPLKPAPTGAHWVRMLYNDFSAFSRDQEYLISFKDRNDPKALDFLEGELLLDQPTQDLSFYPTSDQPWVKSLAAKYRIIYVLEIVKYYTNNTEAQVKQDVANLVKGLHYIPNFLFEKEALYEDFLNREHAAEEAARKQGKSDDVPHPWLDLFIPKSGISKFNEGVFKGIILKQNLPILFAILVYPVNRDKWDDRMSAVTPNEDIFYAVSFLNVASGNDQAEKYLTQIVEIFQFCKNSDIKIKQFLAGNKTREEWVEHFGPKWKLFEDRKDRYDPKRILAPGVGMF